MRYIDRDDLKTDSQDRFITDSVADDPTTADKIVRQTVDMVITYMSGRYDTAKIFDEAEPIRNEVLVDIICKISLYRIFRRNAARKVTTDTKEDYDWALKELDKINSGRTVLKDLPTPEQSGNQPNSDLIVGNISNPNFYI